VAPVDIHTFVQRKEKKKRKDSAGSDDTASMIKGDFPFSATIRARMLMELILGVNSGWFQATWTQVQMVI
jgi:hypothetical protein